MSGRSPSTAFGLPVYNGAQHLAEALESLLTQTRGDLAVVVVDNCSTDGTGELAQRYAKLDPRIVYERTEETIGLVHNWRRAFDLAGQHFPSAPYFAWASDHDVWHDRWLELLCAELELHPEAVLAYPFAVRVDDDGAEYPTREHRFATAGVSSPEARLRWASRELAAAGDLIYGLGRRVALERCRPFPLVVLPDRLFLLRLALEGEFRQVERRLWSRRYRAGVVMSNSRQRRAFFPGGIPWWAYVPWPLTQTVLFARSGGGGLSTRFLSDSIRRAVRSRRERARRRRRWRRRELRQRYRGLARASLERLGVREACAPTIPQAAGDERPDPSAVLAQLGEPGADVLELAPGTELRRADLAVSVDFFDQLPRPELEACVERLHALGVPALYSLDRESPELSAALARRYWLRRLWVDSGRDGERKPDPTTGPVPRPPGRYRHVVGRRRLVPGPESTKLG